MICRTGKKEGGISGAKTCESQHYALAELMLHLLDLSLLVITRSLSLGVLFIKCFPRRPANIRYLQNTANLVDPHLSKPHQARSPATSTSGRTRSAVRRNALDTPIHLAVEEPYRERSAQVKRRKRRQRSSYCRGFNKDGANLPLEEATLRVRHDGKVATVLGAQPGDAVGRAVGVERVGLGRAVGVVNEPVFRSQDRVDVKKNGEKNQSSVQLAPAF